MPKKTKPKKSLSVKGEIAVDAILMEKLLRTDAELRVAQLSAKVAENEWQKTVLRRNIEITTHTTTIEESKKQYQAVVRSIEGKYNVALNDYAYDTETGKLTRIAGLES